MKRLFCVKNTSTGKLEPTNNSPFYFDKKVKAKELRDTLNKTTSKYCVTKGPDHIGTHGNTMSRNRLQPKHVASYTGL